MFIKTVALFSWIAIEKLDREFVTWVLKDGRTKSQKQHYKALREKYPDKTVVLKNQRDLDKFLRELKNGTTDLRKKGQLK